MNPDIYISYATEDGEIAEKISQAMSRRGICCFVPPRKTNSGNIPSESIVSALDVAKVLIIVFSSKVHNSPYILQEVARAFNKGIVIIPFRTEDAVPSPELEYFISLRQWFDAIDPPAEQYLERLCDTVQQIILRNNKDPTLELQIDGLEPKISSNNHTSQSKDDYTNSLCFHRLTRNLKIIVVFGFIIIIGLFFSIFGTFDTEPLEYENTNNHIGQNNDDTLSDANNTSSNTFEINISSIGFNWIKGTKTWVGKTNLIPGTYIAYAVSTDKYTSEQPFQGELIEYGTIAVDAPDKSSTEGQYPVNISIHWYNIKKKGEYSLRIWPVSREQKGIIDKHDNNSINCIHEILFQRGKNVWCSNFDWDEESPQEIAVRIREKYGKTPEWANELLSLQ
jgi:hypothetical protein